MKVFNFFAQVFTIFAYLTIGSLLMIVAGHILSVQDAVLKIQEIYNNPWKSVQVGFVGFSFIMMGLAFARMLIKKGHPAEALIISSESGPIVVSVNAMEDAARKALKKFYLIKETKIKTVIQGKDIQVRLRLVLWGGSRVSELLTEIQNEVSVRVRKMLGPDNKVEVRCDVHKIEDLEEDLSEQEKQTAKISS